MAPQSAEHRREGDQRQQNHLPRPGGVFQGPQAVAEQRLQTSSHFIYQFTFYITLYLFYISVSLSLCLCCIEIYLLYFRRTSRYTKVRSCHILNPCCRYVFVNPVQTEFVCFCVFGLIGLFLCYHSPFLPPLRPQLRRIIWRQLLLRRICTTRKWRK